MNAVNRTLRVIDALPSMTGCADNVISAVLTDLSISPLLFKQASLPWGPLRDMTILGVEKWTIDFYSLLKQNWKQSIPCLLLLMAVRRVPIQECISPLFEKIANARCLEIEKTSLLHKIRWIFSVCVTTLIADRCLRASVSFFVDKRAAPWTALSVNFTLFFLHEAALACLSDPSIRRIPREKTIERVAKIDTIMAVVVTAALLSKPFANRSPLWISAAAFSVREITKRVATNCLIKYENNT